MAKPTLYDDSFDALRCCVLIPTYNNSRTLGRMIDNVLKFTSRIIIVDDGSTDATAEVLRGYPHLQIITLSENRGKGYALRTGFKTAEKSGFEHAISMDSDGQHFPDDLHVFLDAIRSHNGNSQELLVIGSRAMSVPGVPQKSSIGNRFSSFWFWVLTGIKLKDTQCGYRLYPVKMVNRLNLFSTRFELEIEVIVKAAWKGAKVVNLPVKVHYDAKDRVTHFRPFQDVMRITLLNAYFVGLGLFWMAPKNFLSKLFGHKNQKGSKRPFSSAKLPLE